MFSKFQINAKKLHDPIEHNTGLCNTQCFAVCISYNPESTVKYKIADIFKEVR